MSVQSIPGQLTDRTLLFAGLALGAYACNVYWNRLCKKDVMRVPVITYGSKWDYDDFYRGLTYIPTDDVFEYDFYLFTDILAFRANYDQCLKDHLKDNIYSLILCRVPDEAFATMCDKLNAQVVSVMSPFFPGHASIIATVARSVILPNGDNPDIAKQSARRVVLACTAAEHTTYPDENVTTLVLPNDESWLELLHKFNATCDYQAYNTLCIYDREWVNRQQELAIARLMFFKVIHIPSLTHEDGKFAARTCINLMRAPEIVASS